MAFQFTKAVKSESKLRFALAGPAGSGKTKTALIIATALTPGKVAVIDTEHGTAKKYADEYEFDSLDLTEFHPDKYAEAIKAAVDAGYQTVIIDSLTHAYAGNGGLLDIVDQVAKARFGGNTYAGWKEGSQIQNRLIEAILSADINIIATMRSKMDTIQEKDEKGKTVVRKLGMAPIQRDGLEYEFDVYADMDQENNMVIHKTRCSALAGKMISKPTKEVAEILRVWLSGAKQVAMSTPDQRKLMASYLQDRFGDDNAAQKAHFVKHTQSDSSAKVTETAMNDYLVRLGQELHIIKLTRESYGDKADDMLKATLTEFEGVLSLDELDNAKLPLFIERFESELSPVAAE